MQSLEQTALSASSAPLARVEAPELRNLSEGWQAAPSAPEAHTDPTCINALSWIPARVPGTAAAALLDSGSWQAGDMHDFDADDWWFRTSFDSTPLLPGEEVYLCLDGIATVSEVFLNGALVLESESMFAAHALDVGPLMQTSNELVVHCHALAPLLQVRRRPRARWRTQLVAEGNLRFFRTMLLGRLPGIAPSPAAVGPWRAVRLERRRRIALEKLSLHPRLEGVDGVLSVRAELRRLDQEEVGSAVLELSGPSGIFRGDLQLTAARRSGSETVAVAGDLTVTDVATWWPHTHGDPILHDVRLRVSNAHGSILLDLGRVGFRELTSGPSPESEVERDGLDLHVNGVRVFARGAVWTTPDPVGLAPSAPELRAALTHVREAGMNMLRLPGTGAYETSAFHDLCDELGILVWQDFMFANLDYPIADEGFRESVEREVRGVLDTLDGRPSLAVLCGNSEVEQQVAMLGLDPALGRGELFGQLLPALVRERGVDAIYVSSAPCGGDLPFRPELGIANYFGVGGYRRPLEDVRRARVRFAAECLAFSNVPDEERIEQMLPEAPAPLVGHHPTWKAGIPRDAGADWDFEDVRDHYLRLLFGVDVPELRRVDRPRYLELSRIVTGEVMAEVFGEWRRAASPCGGGLVLWLHDLLPGAGWGVLDDRGAPKAAYHFLKRALAPVAVWTVDEGLGGVIAHVANDGPAGLVASLRVALYRDHEQRVEQARIPVELEPHSQRQWNVETLIGHFVDVSWAYRFGPPTQDAIVVSLERADGEAVDADSAGDPSALISQAVRFPVARPAATEPLDQLGLTASAAAQPDGTVSLCVSSRRLVYGTRVHAPGFRCRDASFTLEPGTPRLLTLDRVQTGQAFAGGALTAVNLKGRAQIEVEPAP